MEIINLTSILTIKFDIYSSRTGSNIKVGMHSAGDDSTIEITPNILSVGEWQTVTWDVSGVSDIVKSAIDEIIVTVVNADAENTFYVDNFYAELPPDPGSVNLVSRITVIGVLGHKNLVCRITTLKKNSLNLVSRISVVYTAVVLNLVSRITVIGVLGHKNLVCRITTLKENSLNLVSRVTSLVVTNKNLVCRLSVYFITSSTNLVSRLTSLLTDSSNLVARLTSRVVSGANLVSRLNSRVVTGSDLVCRISVYYISATSNLIARLTSLKVTSKNLVSRLISRVVTGESLVCRLTALKETSINLVARISVYYITATSNLVSRLTSLIVTSEDLVSRLTSLKETEKNLVSRLTSLKETEKNLVSRLNVYYITASTNLVCRINVYYIISSKNLVARISVNYLDAFMWGEEAPASGEDYAAWAVCTDGAGSPPNVIGDDNWGIAVILSGQIIHSTVKDFGYTGNKLISFNTNTYESGSGTGTLSIRGQDTSFLIDAATPTWEAYSTPIRKTWRYTQLKASKE